jgi:hypothetical protein
MKKEVQWESMFNMLTMGKVIGFGTKKERFLGRKGNNATFII